MKAWYLEVKDGDDGRIVVFANTRNEARSWADSKDLMYDRWIDIEARRATKFDGLEKLSQKELDMVLWRDGWEWLDFSTPEPEETSDAEFIKWYEDNFEATK